MVWDQESEWVSFVHFWSLVAIDEEINSMIKIFEADLKRLNGIIVSYKEKKPDLTQEEVDKRNEIINRLREAFKTLKFDLDQQTNIFTNDSGYKYNTKRVEVSVLNDATNDDFQVAENL